MYKKIISFDFDKTLVYSPTAEEGIPTWKKVTGTNWPYPGGGWWGKAETLDMDIFNVQINQWVYARYLEAVADPDAFVMLATGRLEKVPNMRKNVERILNHHNLSFDGVYLSWGDTYKFKTQLFTKLAHELKVDELIMYDDRHDHLIKFPIWASEQSFDVTIIDVIHKTTKTIENK